MYDFCVILTCHLKDKYLDRIFDFRNYGLLNLGTSKIKLFLLTGSNEIPEELRNNWKYDVEFVRSDRFFDGPKLYDFVLNMSSDLAFSCRWWLKVDDDSVTDICGQMKRMDAEFDWTRPEYVFGDYGVSTERIFENAIRKTRHSDNFFHPNTRDIQVFHHEFESCVISSPCMKKIVEDEDCKSFFKTLTQPENDVKNCWHDQGLAVAARFVKVHGSTSLFMTREPRVDNFSLFGGRFTHIHWLHRLSREWPRFLEKITEWNASQKHTAKIVTERLI